MEKRDVKVEAAVRQAALGTIVQTEFEGAEFVGMVEQGAVFETAGGLTFVVRVIVKRADFDAGAEVEAFALEREAKAKAAAEKEAVKARKIAKAAAERKAKAEAEERV